LGATAPLDIVHKMEQLSPDVQLRTLFKLNADGRIVSTREPGSSPGPAFVLIRSPTRCTWGVRAGIPDEIARELNRLAREEPPVTDFRDPPIHSNQYSALVGGEIEFGPSFTFPDVVAEPANITVLVDMGMLEHHFRGWVADEIAERSPILAVVENGHAVSVCFCARRSDAAAEAGVETAAAFRGHGLAARVTAGWALAIRSAGLLPIYSTSWSNQGSLAVARKIGLRASASVWSASG